MPKLNRNLILAILATSLSACAAQQTSPVSNSPRTFGVKPAIVASSTVSASPSKELTLETIMADPDWLGRQPERGFWLPGSEGIGYFRKQLGSPLRDVWIQSIDPGAEAEKVALTDMHLNQFDDGVFDPQRRHFAWSFEGNVFLRDMQSEGVRQLTADGDGASSLQFLDNGDLSFRQNDGFYTVNTKTGLVKKLASWRFAQSPKANKPLKDFIAKEQDALIQFTAKQRRDRQTRFDRDKALTRANGQMAPEPFYFDKKHRTADVQLSPDGGFLLLVTQDKAPTRKESDIMPNYINEDGRIKAEKVRARVADAKPRESRFYLIELASRKVTKLNLEGLPGYNEDVLAAVKAENAKANGETYEVNRLPRHINLISDWYWDQSAIQWQRGGGHVAVMLEAWDNKDRWLVSVDANSGVVESQHRLHDDAWINYKFNSFGWLNNSDTLYYLSEESGYAHLYLKPLNGPAKALTQGQFEVDDLTLTHDNQHVYYRANKKHPGIYEIYRLALNGTEDVAITELNGNTSYQLSPDEQKLLLTHSKLAQPPELYMQKVGETHAVQLTSTVSETFKQMGFKAPQIVPVPSGHQDKPVYSRVYLPDNYQSGEKRRAVVFNHGAGYLQNAHLGWSGYFREFMFHNLLAQQGYVVLDMDFRASMGYGRDWRTAIYRQMGTPEIQDLSDGVKWLVENAHVDEQRIGTYGGSYGGFMTFMALFTRPELFQAGAALRPVSDWAHYNHPYTSNILNTPDDDPIAYRRSSPIYHAEGLSKPLLINAPMVDNNVFFVDVVRLVQRMIELEKEDFETAIYPVEPHGFRQPSSWLDEYRRIFKLFEENL